MLYPARSEATSSVRWNPRGARVTAVDPDTATHSAGSSVMGTARALVALTKPRIIELLLVTTLPTMFLAAGGLPPLNTVLITLAGGALAAGGANTLNQFIDRDIDVLMQRTGRRPLVTGEITPLVALIWGLFLSVLSVALLWVAVNPLSGILAGAAILFYVIVYTLMLKRRTPQNIVWGGAAGCFPVLIGWAAVTGSLSWAPAVLFLIVFLWTPPHYWPLALRYVDDYAAAGVPMLPVVADVSTVVRQILIYSWAMVAASLLLIPVAGTGWVYGVAAVVLGAWFLREAYALKSRVDKGDADVKAMRLFHGSITYLSLLFLAVAVDPFLF